MVTLMGIVKYVNHKEGYAYVQTKIGNFYADLNVNTEIKYMAEFPNMEAVIRLHSRSVRLPYHLLGHLS